MARFEIQPVRSSALSDVAEFLARWHGNENRVSIERRLRWLLLENPVACEDTPLGFCVRDGMGLVRGLNLSFAAAFVAGDHRLLGLASGSFFVEPEARSLGFYLFKRYLSSPGYSFHFATTCNANSSELWSKLGGRAVPSSDREYVLPLRLDGVLPAFVATRTSSKIAPAIARVGSRLANPLLRLLTRPRAGLMIEPCQDWEKLAALSQRHRSARWIESDRTVAFLKWRYGPGSPLYPCRVYLFRDAAGNEGWFSLGNLLRGEAAQIRGSVLLDAIWPRETMGFEAIFGEIVRLSANADAVFLRSQPAMDYRAYSRCVIPYKLPAPRVFVKATKFAGLPALDALDYDDSDYGAWRFQWPGAKRSAAQLKVVNDDERVLQHSA